MSAVAINVELRFGLDGRFTHGISAERLAGWHRAPEPVADLKAQLCAALSAPIDFPPLDQVCIPGDRVVVALDRGTPGASDLVAGIWQSLSRRGVAPESFEVLQPASFRTATQPDPRLGMPPSDAKRACWKIHDATDASGQAYLAATARGERIYLARDLVDADVVISAGAIEFDPVLGYRGTNSVFYPGLSNVDAIKRSRGEGHDELAPENDRPLRQSIDEIAWLLGTQFTVQVIPASGQQAAHVLAGSIESVLRRGRQLLDQSWRVQPLQRAPLVLAAVDADAGGHGWAQVGSALAACRNLVTKGGQIVLLSQCAEELLPGMEMIRTCQSPREALARIRKELPPDVLAAAQLASASAWARVYLLSRLPADVVEELFVVPLADLAEVGRLLDRCESCLAVESAQHAFGAVRGEGAR
jgi:nickel-dependent lactate racemase